MKYRRTNKVGKFEVKKVKNKGAVSKNVVRVANLSTLPLIDEALLACHLVRGQIYLRLISLLSEGETRSPSRGSLLPPWGVPVPVVYESVRGVPPSRSRSLARNSEPTGLKLWLASFFETTSPSPKGIEKEMFFSYPPHPCSTENTTELAEIGNFISFSGRPGDSVTDAGGCGGCSRHFLACLSGMTPTAGRHRTSVFPWCWH